MISGRIVLLKSGLIRPRLCSILTVILNWLLTYISDIFFRLKQFLSLIFRGKRSSTFICESSTENVDDPYTDFFLNYKPGEVDIDEYYNNCPNSDLGNT